MLSCYAAAICLSVLQTMVNRYLSLLRESDLINQLRYGYGYQV
jgi:hypothetical protein